MCSVGEREVGWVGGMEVCVLLGNRSSEGGQMHRPALPSLSLGVPPPPPAPYSISPYPSSLSWISPLPPLLHVSFLPPSLHVAPLPDPPSELKV